MRCGRLVSLCNWKKGKKKGHLKQAAFIILILFTKLNTFERKYIGSIAAL